MPSLPRLPVLSNEASVACDNKNGVFLIAITKAGKAKNLTSSAFINKYRLSSSSSVQSAIKGLLEKNFVTTALGIYEVYDKFFALWLLARM